MFVLFFTLISASWAEQTCEEMFVPEPVIFSRAGDINLAYLAQLSTSKNSFCDAPRPTGIRSTTAFQYADLLPYAVNQINQDDGLLPNVTLGFTVLDGCFNWKVNLARVWTLLLDSCHGIPATNASGKLIGLIGPIQSSISVTISGSLGIHRVPHMAIQATSDELSDKFR